MDDMRWTVDEARAQGASFAEARFAEKRSLVAELADRKVRRATSGAESGASVRVLVRGAWGFAATNRVDRASLAAALGSALATARALSSRPGEKVRLADAPAHDVTVRWPAERDPASVPLDEVRALLVSVDAAAREERRIASAKASYEGSVTTTRYWNTDGSDVTWEVPRLLLQIDLAARARGAPVGYRARIGGTRGFGIFKDEDPVAKAREAAEGAVRLLTANPCPSGKMTVIADPDLTGVFAHEAVGHACEADLVIAGESLLEGRIGERIGNENVTVIDDGGYARGFGSAPFDDEGVRAGRKVLVDRGVLSTFILSRETAGKLGMTPNGGARAESVGAKPLVRMSNTLIEPGDFAFEEMIEDVRYGVYAKGTRGGQVDVAKGSYQFGAQEAWLIEDGEITTPLRDCALQGSILETLKTIDAVGKDARLAAPGICGKGQLVPVGDGGPHIRILGATVGGGA